MTIPSLWKFPARELAALITRYRYSYTNETQLQDGIERVLRSHDCSYRREWPLTAQDRPDFMVGHVVIEVKIKGSFADVIRQLHRYAQHSEVGALVLVTSKAAHLGFPPTLNGKPVFVASLMEGAF